MEPGANSPIDRTEPKTALVPPAGGGGDERSTASSVISGTMNKTESKVTGVVGGSNGFSMTGCTIQDAGRGSMDQQSVHPSSRRSLHKTAERLNGRQF